MDPVIATNECDRDPKQSMRTFPKKLRNSYGSVQKVMKLSGYKPYMANIVQELHHNDYAA